MHAIRNIQPYHTHSSGFLSRRSSPPSTPRSGSIPTPNPSAPLLPSHFDSRDFRPSSASHFSPSEPATPGKTPTATKAPTTPEPPSPTKAPGGKDDAGADKFGIGGKYNFIDIIVDGITVQIGHINVTLTTPDVKASIGLHGFRFFSPAADWSEPSSLKDTRIKNKTLNTITLFKQIELQSLDIELAQRNPKQVGGGDG